MGTFKFGGVATYPLYIAPYTVPDTLFTAFNNNPLFDAKCTFPIIQSAFFSPISDSFFPDYWEACVVQPFDFGHSLWNPTGLPQTPESPGPRIGFDGFNLAFFTSEAGAPFSGINSSGTAWTGAVARSGGVSGEIYPWSPVSPVTNYDNNGYNNFPPNGGGESFNFDLQSTAIVTTVGLCVPYSGSGESYTGFVNAAGQFFNFVNYGESQAIPGSPFCSSSTGVFYPPSVSVPSGRFLPTSLITPNTNGVVPQNIATPETILLDDPYSMFEDPFQGSENVGCSRDFIIGVSANSAFPGQAWTPVLLDCTPNNETFYLIKFLPMTADAQTALEGPQCSVALDQITGTFFVLSPLHSLKGEIFHSQGLVIPAFTIPLDTPTPFVLPCFNPCLPFVIQD
jgi:hypothetical protein